MSRISVLPGHDNPLFDRLLEYRAVLEEQWRRQVANIVELSYEAHSPAAGESDDEGSRGNRLQVSARLIAVARQQLEETEAALARVDDRSYGLCGNCDESIPRERLDLIPAARYCGSCQAGHVIRR